MKSEKPNASGEQNAEQVRLNEAGEQRVPWRTWGPYLSERQWGTVREDYSKDGNAWNYFSHDHARSRAYRWGEDGIAGLSDDKQRLCFALALWNGRDPILKERLFGLTNSEGNHGEDVKEYYFYIDSTPTHSYMKYLYKYPQAAYPYTDLVETNGRRSRDEMEYELLDTGVFAEDRYFDVFVEYAKASAEDVLIKISVHNRGPEAAPLHLLPTLWFRNTWSWGRTVPKPVLSQVDGQQIHAFHPELGDYTLHYEGKAQPLFTENESNASRLWGQPNPSPYVKDAFHEFVIGGQKDAVNPARSGTKAAAHYRLDVPAGGSRVVRLRLSQNGRQRSVWIVRHAHRRCGSTNPTRSTIASRRHHSVKTSVASIVKRSPGCCGRSSPTTSISTPGSKSTMRIRFLAAARAARGTPNGSTC